VVAVKKYKTRKTLKINGTNIVKTLLKNGIKNRLLSRYTFYLKNGKNAKYLI